MAKKIDFLPAFTPFNTVKSQTGKGSYCLYHANLSINENEKAAQWLIEQLFERLQFPLIIAGKSPSLALKNIARKYKNVSIVDTPNETNMQLLIENAQINILPSFNNTGIKLKLLNALFNGRHCLVNDEGVKGSSLENLCVIAFNEGQFQREVSKLMEKPFSEKEMQHRSAALKLLYNNETNVEKLIELLH